MNTPLANSSSPSLFDIIAWVESKNNPHAMRFEPATYQNVLNIVPGDLSLRGTIMKTIKNANNCSDGTARMIHCTSFGAVQIMGFNLYDGLYTGDVVEFMGDPIVQASVFDAFCKRYGIVATPTDLAQFPMLRMQFAARYNGPGAPDAYAAQIVLALQHFGVEVTQ